MSRKKTIPPSVREATRQRVLAEELRMPHVNGTLRPGDERPIVGSDEIVAFVRQVSGRGQSQSYAIANRAMKKDWMYSGAVPGAGQTLYATLPSSLATDVLTLRHVEATNRRLELSAGSHFKEWGRLGGRPAGPQRRARI